METQKIKVAQIVGNATTGGVISCVLNFYRHIDRERFAFDFYSYGPSKFDEEIKALGGNVFYVPKAIRPLSHLVKLKKLLKDGNYNIVHAHLTTLSVVSLCAAKSAKVGIRVCHSHSTTHKSEKTKIIKDCLRPFSRMFATKLAGCSEYSIKWLYGKKAAKNAFLLHNAIDLSKFVKDTELGIKTRRTLGLDNLFVFGTIGRLVYQKNYPFLIDAFAIFAKDKSDVKLLLVGDGDEKSDIIKHINKHGLQDKVSILSEVKDVQKYYSVFDAFLLPSRYEGLPLVAVEAQAMNIPCILSKEITRETDVGGVYGFVDIKSTKAWADAMQKLYINCPSFDVHDALTGSSFDINAEAKRLEQFYTDLVAKRK